MPISGITLLHGSDLKFGIGHALANYPVVNNLTYELW